MANVLFIIAQNEFRDEELQHPREILKDHTHTIASLTTQTATGKLGMTVKPDIDIHAAAKQVEGFDAVIFVGGRGSHVYFDNHAAIELARKAFKSTKVKVLAAICAAVGTLAYAGVLQGKRATSHESVAELVRPRCGEYTGADVTVDGKLITADGPGAAKHFGEEILRLLG